MKFRVGDLVNCVGHEPDQYLTVGKTYEVLHACKSTVWVVSDSYYVTPYWVERFEMYRRIVAPKNRSRVDAGPRTL